MISPGGPKRHVFFFLESSLFYVTFDVADMEQTFLGTFNLSIYIVYIVCILQWRSCTSGPVLDKYLILQYFNTRWIHVSYSFWHPKIAPSYTDKRHSKDVSEINDLCSGAKVASKQILWLVHFRKHVSFGGFWTNMKSDGFSLSKETPKRNS